MSKSTRKPRSRKAAHDRPPKPYPEFPLYPHALGYWSKKILGTIIHFGRWGRVVNGKLTRLDGDTWQEALKVYQAQRDDLYAGRTPRSATDELTVADVCNRFLTAKQRKLDAREIGVRSFAEYKNTTDRLVRTFGAKRRVDDLAAEDFEKLRADLAEQFGPVRLGNEITRVKTVFRYAMENGLIDKPIRFGSEFVKPGKAVLRRHKAANGNHRMMEAEEVRKLIDAATNGVTFQRLNKKKKQLETVTWEPRPDLRAALLLMVNCGYGPMDLAMLTLDRLDLDAGWADYPRPKTGIPRRCWLWPETVEAVTAAIAARPEPRQEGIDNHVFLTARGRKCISGHTANPIVIVVTEWMKAVGVHREGRGAYTLRHVHRTVSDAALDTPAANLIMGHSDGSMAGEYRERIDDSRLMAVAEHVRNWLFGTAAKGPKHRVK